MLHYDIILDRQKKIKKLSKGLVVFLIKIKIVQFYINC